MVMAQLDGARQFCHFGIYQRGCCVKVFVGSINQSNLA